MSISMQNLSGAAIYAGLIAFLDKNRLTCFEFELLPSSYPLPPTGDPSVPLLIDGAALAIRKTDLVRAYLHARTIFFQDIPHEQPQGSCADDPSLARFEAAAVLLLLEPEHLTAANHRKRVLIAARRPGSADPAPRSEVPVRDTSPGPPPPPPPPPPLPPLQELVVAELAFTAALLTSPLARHPRSPTLWSHRAWLLQTFRAELPRIARRGASADAEPAEPGGGGGDSSGANEGVAAALAAELDVVLGAAARHGSNYYAFLHGRRALAALLLPPPRARARSGDDRDHPAADVVWSRGALAETATRTRAWCLAHPRDVAGWTFLAHVLRRAGDAALTREARAAVRRFVTDVGWEGDSVRLFLRSVDEEVAGVKGMEGADSGPCRSDS